MTIFCKNDGQSIIEILRAKARLSKTGASADTSSETTEFLTSFLKKRVLGGVRSLVGVNGKGLGVDAACGVGLESITGPKKKSKMASNSIADARILSHLRQLLTNHKKQDQYLFLEKQRNRQLEKEVESLRYLNHQVMDNVQSSILVVGRDGIIKRCNSAAQTLAGQKTLDGKSFHEVFHLSEPEAKWIDERIITGDAPQSRDINHKLEDGGQCVINMRVHPYNDEASGTQGAVFIMDDVTEQKMVEKRLVRSERSASIGRLSANLAHELGNPLDGVLRYLRLLLDQMPEDDSRRIYAEHAQDGLMRVSGMVRGLLDFARKSISVLSPIDISQSIGRILSSFSDHISAQNIQVQVEFDESVPSILNVDVEQIFINIIKNAIQAMPNGGTLSIKAERLSPEVLEVSVSDTGSGIPDEIRETIFEPFFTTKGLGQGVGLGLSISQEIAESYNGTINVESRSGKGSTFVVRLPIGEGGLVVYSNTPDEKDKPRIEVWTSNS